MAAVSITRRQALEGLVGIGACGLLAGCSSSTAPASVSPVPPAATNLQPVPTGSLMQAALTVTSTAAGMVDPGFASLSYEKSEMCHPLFSANNSALVSLFQLLGPGLLRIGGDSSDRLTWTPNGPGQTYPQIAQSDVNSFAAFLKATGWKCLYTVNLGGSALPPGTQYSTTPALATAEVAYVSAQLGSSLYGIEIGNEPDAYGNAGSFYANANPPWSLTQYESLWNQYRSAILAQTPSVVITGPAGGHLPVWTIPFSETEGKAELSLVTDHFYKLFAQSSPPPSIAALLAYPDSTLVSNLQLLAAAQQQTGLPYRISETNSVSDGYPGVSDTYASALWSLDHMFTCAQGGATGVNFHGGGTANYAPIEDNETSVTSVQPQFYGMLLFTLAGSGTLYPAQLAGVGSLNVTAYAIKTASGLSIIVVNKDQSENLQLAVSLPLTVNKATLIAMTQLTSGSAAPSLSATSGVAIQGAGVTLSGGFSPAAAYTLTASGAQVSCFAPAMTAILIQIT